MKKPQLELRTTEILKTMNRNEMAVELAHAESMAAMFKQQRDELLVAHKELVAEIQTFYDEREFPVDVDLPERLQRRGRLTDTFNEGHLTGLVEAQKKAEADARKRAQKAAEALHSKPNGMRAKKAQLIQIYQSGKFTSKAACAEQECGDLGMSFDTARKALRNIAKPVKP